MFSGSKSMKRFNQLSINVCSTFCDQSIQYYTQKTVRFQVLNSLLHKNKLRSNVIYASLQYCLSDYLTICIRTFVFIVIRNPHFSLFYIGINIFIGIIFPTKVCGQKKKAFLYVPLKLPRKEGM